MGDEALQPLAPASDLLSGDNLFSTIGDTIASQFQQHELAEAPPFHDEPFGVIESNGDDSDALQLDIGAAVSALVGDSGPFEMTAAETTPEDDPVIQYSPAELSTAYDAFKSDKTLPPFLMREQVLDFARQQSVDLMVQEDYDGAYRNDLIVGELLLAYSRESGGWAHNKQTSDLQARLQVAREKKGASQEKYERQLVALRAEERDRLAHLADMHVAERKDFEHTWQQRDKLARFAKPSVRLLQMRRIQKELALAHRFEDAKAIKVEADRLQARETAAAERRALEHVRAAWVLMLERQQQQMACATQFGQRRIRRVEDEATREREANINLARQLRLRLEETRHKRPEALPPGAPKAMPSKTTLQKLRSYKKARTVSVLDVRLTNLNKIFKAK
jgi:hypothetical protein